MCQHDAQAKSIRLLYGNVNEVGMNPQDETKSELTAKILVEISDDTATYYVNHAEVAIGQHELALTFARLPAKPTRSELFEAEKNGTLIVTPDIQVLFAPSFIDGLIEALQITKKQYEERFGATKRSKIE